MPSSTKFTIFLNFFFAGFNMWGLHTSIVLGNTGWAVAQTIFVILGTVVGFLILKDE